MGRATEALDFINSVGMPPKYHYSHLSIDSSLVHLRWVYQANYRPDLYNENKRLIEEKKRGKVEKELKEEFAVGIHKGKSFAEVIESDPGYVVWAFEKGPGTPRSAYRLAKKKIKDKKGRTRN